MKPINYSRLSEQELYSKLEAFRATIKKQGTWITVFERGQCERILMELDRRKALSVEVKR